MAATTDPRDADVSAAVAAAIAALRATESERRPALALRALRREERSDEQLSGRAAAAADPASADTLVR